MSNVMTLTSLPVDSLIRVQIRALNGINWGDFSQLNTDGPTIETIPSQLNAPAIDLTQSSKTSLYISWSALTGI